MNGHHLACRQSEVIRCGGKRRGRQRERGAIVVLFALILLVLVGVIGLSLDVSRLYNRKVELQSLADAAALSGADSLNGTKAGIAAALLAVEAAAKAKKFAYERSTVGWKGAAIQFSTAPAGEDWVSAEDASANPAKMMFIKIDTGELASEIGSVDTIFMHVLAPKKSKPHTSAAAVAGRSQVKVTPLAICAMSDVPASWRTECGGDNPELIQYGYRRGVGYDLMQLNPGARTPANFVVDPIDAKIPSSSNLEAGVVGPYVCSGTLPFSNVVGRSVSVKSLFPLDALYRQLNSRFGQYDGGVCDPATAPPDTNVKPFVFNTAGWMVQTPDAQTAKESDDKQALRTIADQYPGPDGATAPMYGLLWSYAKPVRKCDAALPEPEDGYPTFPQSRWPSLYIPGKPAPNGSYPESTPYLSDIQSPATGPGVARRRVLHVPLLKCPLDVASPNRAEVLAIGRFFMTVPATSTKVQAEFAGIEPEHRLLGTVELYK